LAANGEHGVGKYGIGENGIGEHVIGENGLGEYGIGEYGIGEYGIGEMLRYQDKFIETKLRIRDGRISKIEECTLHQPHWVDEVFFIVIFDSELYLQRSPHINHILVVFFVVNVLVVVIVDIIILVIVVEVIAVDFIMETRTKMSTTMLTTTGCRRQHRRPIVSIIKGSVEG